MDYFYPDKNVFQESCHKCELMFTINSENTNLE